MDLSLSYLVGEFFMSISKKLNEVLTWLLCRCNVHYYNISFHQWTESCFGVMDKSYIKTKKLVVVNFLSNLELMISWFQM